MTSEDVAKRFATRPGFQLVSYREVALPVFKVRLRCLFLEEKPIPPIQEFVLRGVHQGLDRLKDVAGLLGVKEQVVQHSVVELLSSDDLALVGSSTANGPSSLKLTSKGLQTVREARRIVSQEYVLPVVLDGLTREISIEPRTDYLKPAAARDAGLLELAPLPRRRPGLDDFPFDKVAHAVRQRRAIGGNLLAVLGIESRERFFRRDAIALVYKAAEGTAVAVGFVVNGRESTAYEAAFASPDNADYSALTRTIEAPEDALPPELVKAAEEAVDSQQLVTDRDAAEVLVADLEAKLKEADPITGTDDLRAQRNEARARVTELETRLGQYTVRWLQVHEHAPVLQRALIESQERLMIVSPWIRADVVDERFLTALERAAQRGVDIFVGYGLEGEEREYERDKRARQQLEALARDYQRLHLVRFGDTHAKVLVCDHRFAVTTSFNWLSFRGDPGRSFRDERGTYVSNPELVDQQFDFYRPRFDA